MATSTAYDEIMDQARKEREKHRELANRAAEYRRGGAQCGQLAEQHRRKAMELEQAAALLLASLEGPIR